MATATPRHGVTRAAVITPVFREQPARLARCLRSALSQHRPGELHVRVYVVSDDGQGLAPLYAHPRLHHLSTGRVGAGPSVARNLGLDHALADGVDVCALLDSDDWFEPDKLACMTPLALGFGAAVDNAWIRFHDPASADASARSRDTVLVAAPPPGAPADAAAPRPLEFFLAIDNPLWPVFRADVLGELRLLPQLRFAEDSLFNACLIARCGGAAWVPRPLHNYLVRAHSLSHGDDSCARAEQAYRVILEYLRDPTQLGWMACDARARLIAAFEGRRRTNAEYGSWLAQPGHAGRSFQEFRQP